ncbi:MAG: HEAT repeat domain-containing protein [Gemmatimonadota bacterium]
MNWMLIAATMGTMLFASPATPSVQRDQRIPPPAWADADPADSLYRAARRALSDKDYESAARLFESIVSKYPRSEYAPDALYWKGFALYRSGILDEAVDALEAQAKRYPQAGTRSDASALLIQIKGQLAKRGDTSAQRDVDKAAQGSGRTCADMEMQIAALDALQQMDSERVMPLLRRVLARRDDCATPLRKNALFILAQKSGADREKILLDVAKTDPSIQVRQDAVFHLSSVRGDASIDALEDLLMNSDDRGVRQNALFALAQNKSDRARKIMRSFALSDKATVGLRNDAIFHIASGADSQDVAWMKEAYAKIPDQEVRKNLLFHLASRPGPETSKWLVGVVVDPKESMEQRKDALFHLASRKNDSSDELNAVYDKVTVPMKKEILFHIASRHDSPSLDKLIAIAKSDANPELRKDALFYVAQSKDPRALKALEEIVNP